MTDPRLDRLRQVAELVRARAASALEANRQADASLARQIAALRDGAAGTDPDAFQRAGGEARWRQWRQTRIAALNRDRAGLRVARAELTEAAARATARVQVLDRLVD